MARYFRRGTTKIYFVSSISSSASPTVAEMAAGTELTCSVAEISGFAFQNNPIDVPDMCAEFVAKIPGEDTADDSEMTFYEDDTTNPLLTTLAKGTTGNIVFFPYGIGGANPVAGDDCEVWPTTVAKTTREWSAGNDPARFMTTFTVSAVPALTAEVVA